MHFKGADAKRSTYQKLNKFLKKPAYLHAHQPTLTKAVSRSHMFTLLASARRSVSRPRPLRPAPSP